MFDSFSIPINDIITALYVYIIGVIFVLSVAFIIKINPPPR